MMDIAYLEQEIIFFESFLLECSICKDKRGCKKKKRIKCFLQRAKVEMHWKITANDADDQR